MFKEGDIIVDESGDKAMVLGVCGKVFARSYWNDFTKNSGWYKFEQARKKGWKLREPPEDTVKLTATDGTVVEMSKQDFEGLKKL